MSTVLDIKKGVAQMASALTTGINQKSAVRKSQVTKLDLGQVSVFDTSSYCIHSWGNGSTVQPPGRIMPETFPICVRLGVKYSDLHFGKFQMLTHIKDKLLKNLLQMEENEVARRLWNADEIIRAPTLEVKRLRKFFENVGKKVAVLPTGKVLELNDVHLIIRTSPEIQIMENPQALRMDFVAWEDIGFIYEIDEEEKEIYDRKG